MFLYFLKYIFNTPTSFVVHGLYISLLSLKSVLSLYLVCIPFLYLVCHHYYYIVTLSIIFSWNFTTFKSFLPLSRSRCIWGGRVRAQLAGLYWTTAHCARRFASGRGLIRTRWAGMVSAPALAILFHFHFWFSLRVLRLYIKFLRHLCLRQTELLQNFPTRAHVS